MPERNQSPSPDTSDRNIIVAGSSEGGVRLSLVTGRAYTIRLVSGNPVLLYEYPNVSSSAILKNEDSISRGFFKLLLEQSPYIRINEIQKPTLINGKWVYIFRKSSTQVSLVYEVRPSVNGQHQEFEYVSWKSDKLESNRNTFPRKSEGDRLKSLSLDMNAEYYLLLSRIQLPLHRIDFYVQNPDKLAERAVFIRMEKRQDNRALQINLVDFVGVCFAFVEEKNRAVAAYNDYFGNENESTKRYLAGMVTAIEKNRPEIRKWLDYNAATAYLNREELRAKRLLRVKETTTGRLKDWKLSEGYKLTRDDYNGTEEYEKGIFEIECKVTAEDEVQYLAEIGQDDKSWYHRVFFGEEPFLFHRKLAAFGSNFDDLYDLVGKYFIGRFLALLPATAPKAYYTVETIIKIQIKIVKEFEEVIRRTAIKLPELATGEGGGWFIIDRTLRVPRIKYKLTTAIKNRTELDFIDSRAYDKAMAEWKSGIEKASVACKAVLLVIETVNLVFAAKNAYLGLHEDSDNKLFNAINAAGSLADAIQATDFLLKKKLIDIFGKELIEKGFSRVNLIGSICDYIGALKEIYTASSSDKIGYIRVSQSS